MLEQLANISEIAGTAIVIVTIIFLIVQIKQSTQAMRSATALDLTTRLAENYRILSLNEDISALTVTGLNDPESLAPAERARYTAWMIHVFLNFQDLYFQWKNQAYDEEQFDGFMRLLSQMSRTPGFDSFWQDRKFMYSKSFQLFIENDLGKYFEEMNYAPLDAKRENTE